MRVTNETVEMVERIEVSRRRTSRARALTKTAGAIAMGLWLAACTSDAQRDAEQKAAEAKKEAGEAVEKARESAKDAAAEASKAAQDAAATVKESAREAAAKYGPAAKDAALRGAKAAAEVGADAAVAAGRATESAAIKAAGLLRTGAIRAALLRETSLDVSNVDIDTDEPGRRVVIKGSVKTAAQRDAVDRITKQTAPGYVVENLVVVKG